MGTAHTPGTGAADPVPRGDWDGDNREERQVRRDKVLAWLRDHAGAPVMFSDVTRELITNVRKQRARSREARGELRLILASLQHEGVVSLSTRQSGLVIAVREHTPQHKYEESKYE